MGWNELGISGVAWTQVKLAIAATIAAYVVFRRNDIVFTLVVFAVLLLILRYTTLGLQMRAVTQNRRMAASMGNVDERDGWRTHFADTMRGGQYLNSWRMAELHAQESPERARELEAWGALFDRTPEGKILQRNFGGHKYPRLAHVGDRTGLEMIRTLQDHGIHQGMDVHMEVTVTRLLKDGERCVGAFGWPLPFSVRAWSRTTPSSCCTRSSVSTR